MNQTYTKRGTSDHLSKGYVWQNGIDTSAAISNNTLKL